jgi:hypothetical protein
MAEVRKVRKLERLWAGTGILLMICTASGFFETYQNIGSLAKNPFSLEVVIIIELGLLASSGLCFGKVFHTKATLRSMLLEGDVETINSLSPTARSVSQEGAMVQIGIVNLELDGHKSKRIEIVVSHFPPRVSVFQNGTKVDLRQPRFSFQMKRFYFDVNENNAKHKIQLEISASFGKDKYRIFMDGILVKEGYLHPISR